MSKNKKSINPATPEQEVETGPPHEEEKKDMVQVKIYGNVVDLPAKFKEGHVCNENEADALVQAWCENVCNNNRPQIKAAIDAEDEEAVKKGLADLVKYGETYEFGPGKMKPKKTPLEVMVDKVAKATIVRYLKKTNRNLKSIPSDKIEVEMEKLRKDPAVIETAEEALEIERKRYSKISEPIAF